MSEVLAVITATIKQEEMLLLGERKTKKRDGRIVLPGGKSNENAFSTNGSIIEHPVDAVQREVLEETGLLLPSTRITLAACFMLDTISSVNDDEIIDEEYSIDVFRVRLEEAKDASLLAMVSETDELNPFWVPLPHIPYKDMPIDTECWLPNLLSADMGEILTGFIEVSERNYSATLLELPQR